MCEIWGCRADVVLLLLPFEDNPPFPSDLRHPLFAIMKIQLTLPELYPEQKEFVTCPARYTIVEASTKSGKTVGCLIWILLQAFDTKSKYTNLWWVAPVYQQSAIAYRRLKHWLRQSPGATHLCQTNDTDMRITFPTGKIIWFKSAEKPDLLYGEDVGACVIDEASRCREDAWHAVRSTLTATKGHVKIIGNVRGRKNWAYQLARRAEAGEPDMKYFRITASDAVRAGVLDEQEIEDAKRMLPADIFRELYEAIPTDDGGNPFGLDSIAACVAPLSTNKPVAAGIDLAKVQDWTVFIGLDADGRVCTFERWQSSWESTIKRLTFLCAEVEGAIYVDSTGVGDPILEALRKNMSDLGVPQLDERLVGYQFTQMSKQRLMEGLAVAIQTGQVAFPDGIIRFELEQFEYEIRRTSVVYSAPEGLHDDCVCALALAVAARENTHKPVDYAADILTSGIKREGLTAW